jgi:hypothetical protein
MNRSFASFLKGHAASDDATRNRKRGIMSTGYDKALEALQRGEQVKLQRWKTQGPDQNGRMIESFETVALFKARLLVPGEEFPRSSRVISEREADELSKLGGVIDERESGDLSLSPSG